MAALEIITACRQAGVLDAAETLVNQSADAATVRSVIAGATQARDRRSETHAGIRTLCTRVGMPELSHGFIAGGMTFDTVKRHLLILSAKIDLSEGEIDTYLPAHGGTKSSPWPPPAAVYAARRQQVAVRS